MDSIFFNWVEYDMGLSYELILNLVLPLQKIYTIYTDDGTKLVLIYI